jgi:hypothetical protein
VPRCATVFAVGDAPKPEAFLHRHDLTYPLVLDTSFLVARDATGDEVFACLEDLGRTQQTANVIGAEGRGRSHAHELLLGDETLND